MEQELFNPQSSSVDHWGSEYQYYGTVIYWERKLPMLLSK